MHILKLSSALIALLLTYQPIDVEAQCSVVSTQKTTTGNSRHITKFLGPDGPYLCAQTASMSAMCSPGVTQSVTFVHAFARTTAMSPSCMWHCIFCGTITSNTITSNGSDGLPVELMEFSIEQESPQ